MTLHLTINKATKEEKTVAAQVGAEKFELVLRTGMRWIHSPTYAAGNVPKKSEWKSLSAMSDLDGEIFIPGYLLGDEIEVLFAAARDGVPVAMKQGHLYIPVSWIERMGPGFDAVCAEGIAEIRAAFQRQRDAQSLN